MQSAGIDGKELHEIVSDLPKCPLLSFFNEHQLSQIVDMCSFVRFRPGELIVRQGDSAEALFLMLRGEARVIPDNASSEPAGRSDTFLLSPFECIGELGLLLERPRTATVVATADVIALRVPRITFEGLMLHNPGFGLAASRALAARVDRLTRKFVEVASSAATDKCVSVNGVGQPSPDPLPVRELPAPSPRSEKEGAFPKRLEELLRTATSEGASDLYLTAGQPPRLRIDGDVRTLEYNWKPAEREVLELLEPLMHPHQREDFDTHRDADFAIALPDVARFRVNLFRDARGIGAVFRRIPSKVPTFAQLGLPPIIQTLTEHPNGLVLVTGPTGSGKSTTLAAMIDHINRSRSAHIVTLEDPIEYQHESRMALVNQREIHRDAVSFARALRATLREDPDVVLVGELRDLETVRLSLELGNTGHLVFATLHTNNAAAAVDRIIGMFPSEHQNQVRMTLSENLRGVIAQTLCRRIGRGRIAALEVLVVNPAAANLIREGKTFQLPNVMATGRGHGNMLLNDELYRLVRERLIEYREAYARALDKGDFARRFER